MDFEEQVFERKWLTHGKSIVLFQFAIKQLLVFVFIIMLIKQMKTLP